MNPELRPADVAARLAALRELVEPSFDELAARRLAELRALCDLARYLRGAAVLASRP